MSPTILYLTSSDALSPSVRFRVQPFVECGMNKGLDIRRVQVPASLLKRLIFFKFLPKADICIVQQDLLSGRELSCLRKRYPVLGFDFDSAVWTLPPAALEETGGRQCAARKADRFARQCAEVDICIAGNISLARKAEEYGAQVCVIPTGVDTNRYLPRTGSDASRPVQVGWMGTSANMDNLRSALDKLRALAGPIQFQVVSDRPYTGPCQEYVFWEKWAEERELQQLHGMDVGLMPLEDNEFSRGKCGFKLLQYMSCGIPPVASSVGVCREIIDHGIDGFLVDDPSEWDKYVMHLLDDPSLRETMGRAAREKIRSRYEVSHAADMLWHVLDV